MVDTLYLSVNQEVELSIQENDFMITYRVNVDRIAEDGIRLIYMPDKKRTLNLKPGANVKITYADNSAMYNFVSVVQEVSEATRTNIKISIPNQVNRTQRRNFVRVDVRIPLSIAQTDDNLNVKMTEYSTMTKDLSGGGLLFTAEIKLAIGTEIEIKLSIPNQSQINAIGKVVRCIPTGMGRVPVYSIGVEFTYIEKLEREKIIKYLFEHQRELRKKGLI